LPSPISLKDLFKKFYDLNSEIKQERVNRWGEFMSQKLFAEVQSKFAELKILTQNFNILDLLESLETKPTLDQILNICSRITVKKIAPKIRSQEISQSAVPAWSARRSCRSA
jgi:hypothetical protein